MATRDFVDMAMGPELDQALASGLAILPVSAIEQHGPHLPLGTDAHIVDALKPRLIDEIPPEIELVWLPHLVYGSSEEHRGFPGTLSLRPSTLMDVLDDICASLAASGARRLAFLNGHGGNAPLLQVMARQARKHGLSTSLIRPLAGLDAMADGVLDMHAGRSETSVLLHLRPDLVDLTRLPTAEGMADARTPLTTELLHEPRPQVGWVTADLSRNGVIGAPYAASAEHGHALVAAMVRRAVQELARVSELHQSATPSKRPEVTDDCSGRHRDGQSR